MKNLLTLHKSVFIVMFSQLDRTATLQTKLKKEIYSLKEKEKSL